MDNWRIALKRNQYFLELALSSSCEMFCKGRVTPSLSSCKFLMALSPKTALFSLSLILHVFPFFPSLSSLRHLGVKTLESRGFEMSGARSSLWDPGILSTGAKICFCIFTLEPLEKVKLIKKRERGGDAQLILENLVRFQGKSKHH